MCNPMFLGAGPPFCALSDKTRNLKNLTKISWGVTFGWEMAKSNREAALRWEVKIWLGKCKFCTYAIICISEKNPICSNTRNTVILLLLLLFISFLGGYFSGPSKCSASNWYPCLFCHFVHLVSHLWSVRPLWWTALRWWWSGVKGGTGVWNAVKQRGRKLSIGPSPVGRRSSMKRLCWSIRTLE